MPKFLFEPAPHDEAVAFLKDKPVVSRAVFDQVIPEVRGRVFAVTGIESARVLQSLRDRIADIPAGGDWDAIKADVVAELSPFLGEGEEAAAAAERKAELLLRTHGYQSYAATQYQVMDRQRDVFPFWRYQTAQDDRVRDAHAALDGIVLPANDPFWQTHFPPWDFNCRCTIVPLSRDDLADVARDDEGKPPEERSILTADQADRMNNSGMLVRGPSANVDVRSPLQKGRPDGYAFTPGDLRLKAADIKARYEAPVWSAFEAFARRTLLDGAPAAPRSLWDWLNETRAAIVPPAATTAATSAVGAAAGAAAEAAPWVPQNPVSNALDVQAKGPVRAAVNHTLRLIDQAHDDGVLPTIPISGKVDHPTARGTYTSTRGGRAVKIGVRASGPTKLMTTAHELGHFIDHQALDVAGQFASVSSLLLQGWRAAVLESEPVKLLLAQLATETSPDLLQMLAYLTKPQELWARSYAQYIATRTGDAGILAELSAMRKVDGVRQWSEAQFAPIAREIDLIFKMKGWIK